MKKIIHIGLLLLLGVLIGTCATLLPIPATVNIGVIFGLGLLLTVMIYLGIVFQLKLLLFIMFLTFGLMNTAIKPFDLLFVLAFLSFFLVRPNKIYSLQEDRYINYSILVFISVSLLSVLKSSDVMVGISYFIHTIFVILIFYFLTVFIRSRNEFNIILWGYTFSAFISSVVVIAEISGMIGYVGTLFQGIRAKGFFMDPNDFSPFLILAIIFLLDRSFKHHYFSLKYFLFMGGSFIIMGALLASLSRAAIMNFVIVTTLYLVFTLFYKKLYGQVSGVILIVSLTAIIMFLFWGDMILNQIDVRFSHSSGYGLQNYDSDRFYYQMKGLMLGTSNLLGIGPGQFELLNGYATHNLFVRIIAENGWISFFAFFIMIIYLFVQLFINRRTEVWNIPIYLFFAVYVGVLLNSFFLDTLHWRYFWFILGLCWIVLKQAKKQDCGKQTY